MIHEWFQMSLRHLGTTIFDAGKLEPKYLFKTLFILWKSRIFIQNKYSFVSKSRIFIQSKYSFFLNPEYSFKKNIHFLKIQNIHSNKIFIFSKRAVSPRATLGKKSCHLEGMIDMMIPSKASDLSWVLGQLSRLPGCVGQCPCPSAWDTSSGRRWGWPSAPRPCWTPCTPCWERGRPGED